MRKPIRQLLGYGFAAMACLSLQAQAITPEHFVVHNTQDIIDVCATDATDPLYTAAIHFCHGYLVGTYQYQESLYSGPNIKQVVCFPEPRPTRNEGISKYIQWATVHPEYAKDRAVDTLARFLVETWPCKS